MIDKLLFFILLIGILVLVHELGHFLVAKACRVQVFKFSLGFGPELLAFQIGETRYAISLFPLGGYVRMAGEEDLVERWGGPEAPPADPKRLLSAKPLWQRIAIILAGPLANLILPFMLFSVTSWGESQVVPPIIQTVLPGTPAERSGLKTGDRIVSVDGEPVETFGDIPGLVGDRAGETVQLKILRAQETLDVALELRRATDRDQLLQVVERGRIGVASFRRLPVVAVDAGDNPARQAGLRSLDRVLQIDGTNIEHYEQIDQMLRDSPDRSMQLMVQRRSVVLNGALRFELPQLLTLELPARVEREQTEQTLVPDALGGTALVESADVAAQDLSKTVAAARRMLEGRDAGLRGLGFAGSCIDNVMEKTPAAMLQLSPGACVLAINGKQALHWGVLRETFAASPTAIHTAVIRNEGALETVAFRLKRHEEKAPLKRGYVSHIFGTVLPDLYIAGPAEKIYLGFFDAIVAGARKTASLTALTVKGIGLLFSGKISFQTVGGPVMLFDLAGKTAERGASYFLFIMAFISINLAVLNLLPVPVLDGGHLLFFLIEAVLRRPVSMRVRELANLVGLSLLILLMVAVARNDISRYWEPITNWFK